MTCSYVIRLQVFINEVMTTETEVSSVAWLLQQFFMVRIRSGTRRVSPLLAIAFYSHSVCSEIDLLSSSYLLDHVAVILHQLFHQLPAVFDLRCHLPSLSLPYDSRQAARSSRARSSSSILALAAA